MIIIETTPWVCCVILSPDPFGPNCSSSTARVWGHCPRWWFSWHRETLFWIPPSGGQDMAAEMLIFQRVVFQIIAGCCSGGFQYLLNGILPLKKQNNVAQLIAHRWVAGLYFYTPKSQVLDAFLNIYSGNCLIFAIVEKDIILLFCHVGNTNCLTRFQ